jgi:hypothetical protein
VGGALVGHFAENAIKKHNKDKKEDAYGHSQYGGSQHSGHSNPMDSLGSFFKK